MTRILAIALVLSLTGCGAADAIRHWFGATTTERTQK